MAALCQQHRSPAFFLVAPFAAHKGDGQMMVADMFCGLNVDNVTDLPAQQSLLDCDIEGRIPQNVADHHLPPGLFYHLI